MITTSKYFTSCSNVTLLVILQFGIVLLSGEYFSFVSSRHLLHVLFGNATSFSSKNLELEIVQSSIRSYCGFSSFYQKQLRKFLYRFRTNDDYWPLDNFCISLRMICPMLNFYGLKNITVGT
jgi:hypothetical protein